MRFVDKALLQLGDEVARKALFGAALAERLVAACYGGLDLFTGPFSADPAGITIGAASDAPPRLRGRGRGPGGQSFELDAELLDFVASRPAYPALVQGTLSAKLTDATGRVSAVTSVSRPLPTLAELEAAASSSERSDPAALERRRRIELARTVAEPTLGDDAALLLATQWAEEAGAPDVPALLQQPAGPAAALRIGLTFEPVDAAAPRQRTARFAAGVIIGDPAEPADGLLTLLGRAREVQQLLRGSGHLTGAMGGIEPVIGTPVVLLLPKATFSDPGWPGGASGSEAARAKDRETRAAAWLAAHGIALGAVE